MRQIFASLVGIVLLATVGLVFAQSLGDIARETRQKEKAKGTAKKKVITNEEIPESPDLNPGSQETVGNLQAESPAGAASGSHSADEWKSTIQAQKNRVASLQAQIDKLNASIHYVVESNYYNGVQYNQHQAKKQQQVENLKVQLAEQKKKLDEMQEAARKAGMGSAVYDP